MTIVAPDAEEVDAGVNEMSSRTFYYMFLRN